MSDRTDLIELLEGQAVYLGTCRRDNHLGRIKLLLREEILDRNVRALAILRAIQPPTARQIEIDRLRLELGQARAILQRLRGELVLYEEQSICTPTRGHPYQRDDALTLVLRLRAILQEGK